ncbi:MAG TPA: cation diffusion facilitator family transporter [Bacteroidales bacterium]
MSHDHNHNHNQSSQTGENRIRMAFFLNVLFALLEIAGSFFTNSVAILSNALHDLGDSLSLGLAWYFQRLSARQRDKLFSFGYMRFSVLGALINSMVLLIGSVFIISKAIPRVFNPVPIHTQGMFYFALIGITINGIAAWRLKKGDSVNEKVISLHLLEDVLGWAAVLIVSIVMMFYDVPLLDPLLSLIITIYILWNVFKNLKSTLRIFLQGTPEETAVADIEKKLLAINDVTGVHDLHLWSMDGLYHVLSVHITVARNMTLQETQKLKLDIRNCLEILGIQHTTVEIEQEDEICELTNC